MNFRSKMNAAYRLLFGLSTLFAIATIASQTLAATDQPPIPRGVALKSWHENGRDGRYLLQLFQGAPLKAGKPIAGVVTNDTDCDADADGLSHCHNTIQLPNGSQITVINTHRMHSYRCLGTGDRIALTRVKGKWIMGTLAAN